MQFYGQFLIQKKPFPPLVAACIGTRCTSAYRDLCIGFLFSFQQNFICQLCLPDCGFKSSFDSFKVISQTEFQLCFATPHWHAACSKEQSQGWGLRPSHYTTISSISIKLHLYKVYNKTGRIKGLFCSVLYVQMKHCTKLWLFSIQKSFSIARPTENNRQYGNQEEKATLQLGHVMVK